MRRDSCLVSEGGRVWGGRQKVEEVINVWYISTQQQRSAVVTSALGMAIATGKPLYWYGNH